MEWNPMGKPFSKQLKVIIFFYIFALDGASSKNLVTRSTIAIIVFYDIPEKCIKHNGATYSLKTSRYIKYQYRNFLFNRENTL